MPKGVKEVQSQRPRYSHQARRKNTEAARDGLRDGGEGAGAGATSCPCLGGRSAGRLIHSSAPHNRTKLKCYRLKESNYV